jgi:hypothetical protein
MSGGIIFHQGGPIAWIAVRQGADISYLMQSRDTSYKRDIKNAYSFFKPCR